MASIAVSLSPQAVMKITGSLASNLRIRSKTSNPEALRQHDVEQHDVGRFALQGFQSLGGRAGRTHANVAGLEGFLDEVANAAVIVDCQHG